MLWSTLGWLSTGVRSRADRARKVVHRGERDMKLSLARAAAAFSPLRCAVAIPLRRTREADGRRAAASESYTVAKGR
jgi:hypothetical protein